MSVRLEADARRGFRPGPISGLLDIITRLGAAAAIVIAYSEYVDKQREARVERVQQFVVRSQEGPISASLSQIVSEVREHEAALVDLDASNLSDEAAQTARRDLVKFLAYESGADGSGLRTHLDSAFNFFDTIEVCVEERLCDPATARAFFAKPSSRLIRNFFPYIQEQRTYRTDYARAAEALANRAEGPAQRSLVEVVQGWFKV